MGGEVLELLNDRAERMEREAREKGLAQGLQQGIEQGIERGIARGTEDAIQAMSERLAALGVSREVIAQAVADMRTESREATK